MYQLPHHEIALLLDSAYCSRYATKCAASLIVISILLPYPELKTLLHLFWSIFIATAVTRWRSTLSAFGISQMPPKQLAQIRAGITSRCNLQFGQPSQCGRLRLGCQHHFDGNHARFCVSPVLRCLKAQEEDGPLTIVLSLPRSLEVSTTLSCYA
jgi:hypothetical protein